MLQSFDASDPETGFKLLEDLLSDIHGIQQQVLKEIVTENARTEYLKGFLEGRSDADLYKKKVPVVDYEDIENYIERIVNGETSEILLAQPILELVRSSGTSGGRQKLMPTTAEDWNRKTTFLNLLVAVLSKHIEGLDQGKAMHFVFIRPEFKSPGGLNTVPALTSYYKSANYRSRPFNRFTVNTSPDDVILCPDMKQSMYCQLLCGLVQRDDVVRIGTSFASSLLKVIKGLEDQWQELCSNIRTGCISDWITDSNCRNAAASVLNKPMPDLATVIEKECSSCESWEGIIQRVWPRTKCVGAILTGSMAQYIPRVEFYCGSLPLVSMPYASSEGYFGINLKPLCKPCDVAYTLIPNMAYYEFLPFDKTKELEQKVVHPDGVHVPNDIAEKQNYVNDEIVDLGNVKIGQHYELVVTTYTGLYRCKTGDVLACTGFLKNAPQFRFVQRRNTLLSIDGDKTSEEDLLKSISEAMRLIEPLGFMLADYTSCTDTSNYPGHYVLFWELQIMKGKAVVRPELDSGLMEQCCFAMEQSLDPVYRRARTVMKEIGPLEIRVVKNGTFDELMYHQFLSPGGTSMSQYKTPRCITSEKTIEMMNSRVVGKFFSKKLPSSSPELERKGGRTRPFSDS